MDAETLKIRGLTVRFGGLKAVDGVDFSIFKHEIVSLIGPNGAGKTTAFNAITGFIKASGRMEFEGYVLSDLRPHAIASKGIVRTFQITSLFPKISVLDNLRISYHLQENQTFFDAVFDTKRKSRVEEETLRKTMEILRFIDLENEKDRMAGALPYGKQRILEAGIALAASPKLLLLDEPSAGLNDTETQEMMELIIKIRDRGVTILLVEHDMKLVMGISDRIIVLNFGKKIAEGKPDEIKTNPEVIAAYLGGKKEDAHH